MSYQTRSKSTTVRAAIAALILLMTGACNSDHQLRIGMCQEDVVQILGEPSREAVLIGKELRNIDQLPASEDVTQLRLVFIYDESGLQVWFKDGKVTGVTQNGVSVIGN